MFPQRTPMTSLEAIFLAYGVGLLTSFAFTAYGKFLERRFSQR